jgi:hypothetical protein
MNVREETTRNKRKERKSKSTSIEKEVAGG